MQKEQDIYYFFLLDNLKTMCISCPYKHQIKLDAKTIHNFINASYLDDLDLAEQ